MKKVLWLVPLLAILIVGCANVEQAKIASQNTVALSADTVAKAEKLQGSVAALKLVAEDRPIDNQKLKDGVGVVDADAVAVLDSAKKTNEGAKGTQTEVEKLDKPDVKDIADKTKKGAEAAAGVVSAIPHPYAKVAGIALIGIAALAGVVSKMFSKEVPANG